MNPTPNEASLGTSLSLLERAKAHDSEAWRRIVELYGPIVYGWARTAGLREHDASDVTQDVFLAAYSSLDRFAKEKPGDRFRAWLWTIAHRRTTDFLRKTLSQPIAVGGSDALRGWRELADPDAAPLLSADDETAATDLANRGLARRALELIRGEFEDRTFQACMKTTVEGRNATDVAVELKMSVGAVYVARSRVLKRLREELDGLL